MIKECNIYLAGIGGQGIMLLSQVLTEAALKENYKILVSEVHGGAQRGGAAGSHIRMGNEVYSPIIPLQQADVLIGLEPIEAVRVAHMYLKDNGHILINPNPVAPVSVLTGKEEYPSIEKLKKDLIQITNNIFIINATHAAENVGRRVLANVVMLGALVECKCLPLKEKSILDALLEKVPQGTGDINRLAFEAGKRLICSINVLKEE